MANSKNHKMRQTKSLGRYGSFLSRSSSVSLSDYMRIPLTQGLFALVDAEDYDWLNQWQWYAHWNRNAKTFYAIRNGKRTKCKPTREISMAREILGLKRGDKRHSDHINHITLDNRESNLRIVTCQQNQFNQRNPKGYYWHKIKKKYIARIKLNGKIIQLGRFLTPDEAHNAYLEAKKKYHKIPSHILPGWHFSTLHGCPKGA